MVLAAGIVYHWIIRSYLKGLKIEERMMTKKVDFYFDFASPNAYLSHKVMQSIKERSGAEINYIPVLLGGIFKLTNNKPPMEQFFGVKNKNEYQNSY